MRAILSPRDQIFEQILKTLDRMPLDARKAFILRRYERLLPEEIAEEMGVSVERIEVLLKQAGSLLRENLHPLVPN